jgi:transcriptional regulator with XRE-family HTH domain
MAKIKVRPRPGALSELLKSKGMTQMDAASVRKCADRKTLLRIDRGEEVKRETLQQVAKQLQVPEEYFLHSPAAEATGDNDVPEPGTIMLRKLDAARLEQLLKGAERLEWQLSAQVRDDEARKFLEDFETAVEKFQKGLRLFREWALSGSSPSLRHQLDRLQTADDIAASLEQLAEHRLALLGADYLFWDCDSDDGEYEDNYWTHVNYRSSRIVLLSVEPGGTQSRRAPVSHGSLPPAFAPSNPPRDVSIISVNGVELPTRLDSDMPSLRTLDNDDIPF